MNDADGVAFSETKAWAVNSVMRKKRDVFSPKHKVSHFNCSSSPQEQSPTSILNSNVNYAQTPVMSG